jgi:hypothetical protein
VKHNERAVTGGAQAESAAMAFHHTRGVYHSIPAEWGSYKKGAFASGVRASPLGFGPGARRRRPHVSVTVRGHHNKSLVVTR